MSTKNDYSAEDWKAITGAPVAAGLFITLSDASGPIGIAREAMAVGKAIADSASVDAPEIVKSVATALQDAGGKPELPDVPRGDRAQTRLALIAVINQAVGAVEKRSPDEAGGYKTWLASVAHKVSEASKEGSILGFGGTLVSEDEQQGLRELGEVLGVKA
jgi:hypothetical protein